MNALHDVVILGGPGAGAATALVLARLGHDTVVIDRATPDTSSSGYGLSADNRDAGVLADALDAALLADHRVRRDDALRELFDVKCALAVRLPMTDEVD